MIDKYSDVVVDPMVTKLDLTFAGCATFDDSVCLTLVEAIENVLGNGFDCTAYTWGQSYLDKPYLVSRVTEDEFVVVGEFLITIKVLTKVAAGFTGVDNV